MDVAADGTSNGNSNDGEITVAWTALANATSYTVTVKDNLGVSVGMITSTGATSARVAGLDAQADYTVTVVANNGSVDSTVSSVVNVKTLKEFLYEAAWNLYGITALDGAIFVDALTNKLTLVYNDASLPNPIELVVNTTGATTHEEIIGKITAVLPTSTLQDYVAVDYVEGVINYPSNNENGYHNMRFWTIEKGSDVSLKLLKNDGTSQFTATGDFNEE